MLYFHKVQSYNIRDKNIYTIEIYDKKRFPFKIQCQIPLELLKKENKPNNNYLADSQKI